MLTRQQFSGEIASLQKPESSYVCKTSTLTVGGGGGVQLGGHKPRVFLVREPQKGPRHQRGISLLFRPADLGIRCICEHFIEGDTFFFGGGALKQSLNCDK